MNVLNQLNHYLSDNGADDLEVLYNKMLENEHVRRNGIRPTRGQWIAYFERLKCGCEYAKEQFGPESLPSILNFYGEAGEIMDCPGPTYIFYGHKEDELGISYLWAAWTSADFGTRNTRNSSHFPHRVMFRAEDFTTLNAIEECYHRYQIVFQKKPSANTAADRNHPLEIEVSEILKQAVKALNIQVY